MRASASWAAPRRLRRSSVVAWVGLASALAAAIYQIGLLAAIIGQRIGYPLDLEWMEGGMLCHALRAMQGKPIYGPPSVEFISYLYTPFYPLLVAALGHVVGLSYVLGRAVSVASLFVACGVIVLAARNHGQRGGQLRATVWGFVGVGLFCSAFPHTEAWYDLARNDSLFLALTASALYLLFGRARRPIPVALAGLCMGLAFLTKQTASVFVLASGLALLLLDWRRLLIYVPSVGLVAGGGVLAFQQTSAGWFWRYVFEMHQGHAFYPKRLWPETELELLQLFPALAGLSALWLLVTLVLWLVSGKRPTERGKRAATWLYFALVGVFVAALGFATQWAEQNAYIPAVYFMSLFAAIAATDLSQRLTSLRPSFGACASFVIGLALAAQLVSLRYSPKPHVPPPGDWRAARALLGELARARGPVLVPYHPFYPYLVGKPTHYHQMGINDVTRAGHAMPGDIHARIEAGYYDMIVLDTPPGERYGVALRRYKLARYLGAAASPHVVTGYRVSPTYVFVQKQREPPPRGTRRIFDFEAGDYQGWQISGRAFGSAPVGGETSQQGLAGPFEGAYLASSLVGGEGATGTLRSPEFEVRGDRLTYRIGGARLPETVQLRLLVDGQEVHRDTGPGGPVMVRRDVDVSALRGRRMQLELVDQAGGAGGYILFDELAEARDRR